MKNYEEYMKKVGDRRDLYSLLSINFPIKKVLYPGSYVDITPSIYFPYTVYVDNDKKAKKFFKKENIIKDFISENKEYPENYYIKYYPNDYRSKFNEEKNSFDLLISQYAGFISKYCKNYLKDGGFLLVNDSHGDASMTKLDRNFRLIAVIDYKNLKPVISQKNLDQYFILKKQFVVTPRFLEEYKKGIDFTKKADFYLFKLEY